MIEPAQSTKPTPVINIVDRGDDLIAVDVVSLPEACVTPKRKHTDVSPEIHQGKDESRQPLKPGRRIRLEAAFSKAASPLKKNKKETDIHIVAITPAAPVQAADVSNSPQIETESAAAAAVAPAVNAAVTAVSAAPPATSKDSITTEATGQTPTVVKQTANAAVTDEEATTVSNNDDGFTTQLSSQQRRQNKQEHTR